MPDDFIPIWIVCLEHQSRQLPVKSLKGFKTFVLDAVPLDIPYEEPFLKTDGKIHRVREFLAHDHSEAGETFVYLYGLKHLPRKEYRYSRSLQRIGTEIHKTGKLPTGDDNMGNLPYLVRESEPS